MLTSTGSFSFPNISIAILINNLLDPNPLRSRLLLGMSILQVIFAMISVFLVFLQCKPTAALWDHTIEGDCWPESVFYDFSYWVSAYTTMTDIILAIVPVSVFWKLQMPRSTKIGVCVMMSLTLLSAIVTIVKATYLPLFTNKEDPRTPPTPTPTLSLLNIVTNEVSIQRHPPGSLGPHRAKRRHRRRMHPNPTPLLPTGIRLKGLLKLQQHLDRPVRRVWIQAVVEIAAEAINLGDGARARGYAGQ